MALVRSSGDGPLGDLSDVVAAVRLREEVKDRFAPILKMYEKFLDVEPKNIDEYVKGISVQVTPPEINQFMRMTQAYDGHPQYNSGWGHTGIFISGLMQCAIRDEHVDFTLDMNGLQPLHTIGYGIAGTLENKVNVTIHGEVGDWCLGNAQNVETVNIGKTGDRCLHHAQNVGTVNIGEVGNNCLWYAQKVGTVNIGKAGDWCLWYAQKVGTVNIGKAGDWCLQYAQNVGTANIGEAGNWCLYDAQKVGTVNIGKAGDWCLYDARNVGNVYTPSPNLVRQIKNTTITWKKGCRVHHISQEDFDARMRR